MYALLRLSLSHGNVVAMQPPGHQTLLSWLPAMLGACILAYLSAVHMLRHRRADTLAESLNIRTRTDYAKLTADQAQSVLQDVAQLEFPRVYSTSILFALFKTYGIPSISALLVSTRELSSPSTMSKRAADTGILLLELCLHCPSSPRARAALARTNYLHSKYRKSNMISNRDMLFTLSLFALEPVRWVQRFEWRALNELELCSTGTLWKAIGDCMDISYECLPSCRTGWADGLHWLKEVELWSAEYEKEHMVPAESNAVLSAALVHYMVPNCTAFLLPYLEQIVAFLLGDRAQRAMKLPAPSGLLTRILNALLETRKAFIRRLMLPRPHSLRKQWINEEPDPKTGKYHALRYLSHPWYVRPTLYEHWRLRAWWTRPLGGRLPGDDGDRFHPEGYNVSALGPRSQSGNGAQYISDADDRMEQIHFGGCPFH